MKVKIAPITKDAEGRIINTPISSFTVDQEGVEGIGLFVSEANDDPMNNILSDMRNGSITPTTFKSREFVENTADQWFIDNYEYNHNKVIRFGINASHLTLDDLNVEVSHHIESKTEIVNQNRLGEVRSTSSSSTSYKAIAESIVHTPIERIVFTNAVSYLLDNNNAKVVLVDIFERNQYIIQMAGLHPTTHTVVLYKNPLINEKHEILVIDPSNFIFSSHLSNSDIVQKHDLLDKITVLHKKDIQIYKPDGDTGQASHQYRDCVDLSAKIAFGLNKMDNWSKLDLKEIKDWDVIKELSNNKKIDSSIIALDLPIRIKQTSDTMTIHKFNTIEKSINNILDITALVSMEIRSNCEAEFCSLLENIESDSSLVLLVNHHKHCIKALYTELTHENTILLGLIEGGDYET